MSRWWRGAWAIAAKEALHIGRDRLTLALLISVPLVQLLLFGTAIDLHPKALPTALVAHEDDRFTQRAVAELEAIGYFRVVARSSDLAEARRWLAESRVQFVLALPPQFGFKLITGQLPSLTLIADDSDPVAALVATEAARTRHAAATQPATPLKFDLRIERPYNPNGESRRFIVPGLLGVVLTLTLVLLGAFALVREREQGSFEWLALLPIARSAVLVGKALPYFVLGCLLFALLLGICTVWLDLPWRGFSAALWIIVMLFVAANLALGLSLSLIARNSMQAMQLGVFFYLPSMLLSGFMFPFHGMPGWARAIGETLPLTHFLRVVRGLLLKDLPVNSVPSLAWPILLFAALAGMAAVLLFRRQTSV